MKDLFDTKQQQIRGLFTSLTTPEAKYEKIIQLGRELPDIENHLKIPKNLVPGCQSQMFLTTRSEKGVLFFQAWSDALISAGLAYLLIATYSGFSPEIILKEPPKFLEELELFSVLSPTRSNGLKSLHLKMQQKAIQHLSRNTKYQDRSLDSS
ncbi:MAG: SufE family protein [Chlamydiales bacterium]